MGTGKTLICLSLILSTLHQPSRPPPHEIDLSPVTTKHIIETYPHPEAQSIRDQSRLDVDTTLALPSLSEICANILACNDHPRALGLSAMHVDQRLSDLIHQNTFYLRYPPDTSWMRCARVANVRTIAERVYLSRTTLVVVPPILVEQWMQEIEKHVESGALKVLKVGSEELPGIMHLLDYDVCGFKQTVKESTDVADYTDGRQT